MGLGVDPAAPDRKGVCSEPCDSMEVLSFCRLSESLTTFNATEVVSRIPFHKVEVS